MTSHFWRGFQKHADVSAGDGGGGFSGVGKMNLQTGEAPLRQGTVSQSTTGGDPTMTDKTLLDRERNPRDFSPFSTGPELQDEVFPIKY